MPKTTPFNFKINLCIFPLQPSHTTMKFLGFCATPH